MKTKPKSPTPPSAAKKAELPRARARRIALDSLGTLFIDFPSPGFKRGMWLSVHPHATAADARRFAAFWNKGDAAQIEAIAELLFSRQSDETWPPAPKVAELWMDDARAVLALFAGKGAKS